MKRITDTATFSLLANKAGFDPIEERLRSNVRATIEAIFEEEFASFLGRLGYDRAMVLAHQTPIRSACKWIFWKSLSSIRWFFLRDRRKRGSCRQVEGSRAPKRKYAQRKKEGVRPEYLLPH